MRKRLIITFVAIVVTIIGLYGIPRIFTLHQIVHSSEVGYTERMADLMSIVIAERIQIAEPVDQPFLDALVADGEGIRHVAADGTVAQAGAALGPDDITTTASVADGGTVTFIRSAEAVSNRLATTVAPVILVGIVLLLASTIIVVILAGRLARPFVRLVETAKELGHGGIRSEPVPTRIPEAAAIDRALRTSAETLERRIRREHEFAANASHQLRTPITALRLELEDLSLWGETPPSVRTQLEHAVKEIDRLADAITHLLALARGEEADVEATEPLEQMLRHTVGRWGSQAATAGRSIRLATLDPDLGVVPSAASQVFDVLLHNAIQHGQGTIGVSAVRRAEYVTVQVADEGPRPHGNSIFQRRPEQRTATSGEGIGLALSAELVESLGGHLLLEGDETTTFSVILPARG